LKVDVHQHTHRRLKHFEMQLDVLGDQKVHRFPASKTLKETVTTRPATSKSSADFQTLITSNANFSNLVETLEGGAIAASYQVRLMIGPADSPVPHAFIVDTGSSLTVLVASNCTQSVHSSARCTCGLNCYRPTSSSRYNIPCSELGCSRVGLSALQCSSGQCTANVLYGDQSQVLFSIDLLSFQLQLTFLFAFFLSFLSFS
jgi:hypothetical protein